MRLGDIAYRDAYSYELAAVFMGAESRAELRRNFSRLWDSVGVRFEEQE